MPYLGVFLDGREFSSQQIGELFALITIARILGPNLWATMADKSGQGVRLLQLGSFLTLGTFCTVFFADGFWPLTIAFGLMMMFWTAILPQLEVTALNSVANDPARYSRIRLWGSIGFILLTMGAGFSIDFFGSEAPIYVSAVVLLFLFLACLGLNEQNPATTSVKNVSSLWHKLFKKEFIIFILSASFLQISFGTYYSFFALYLIDLGYSGYEIGFFVALGVAAEIIIFLLAGRIISRIGVKWALLISVILTAVRWYLLADFALFTTIIIISQLLHAFGFGLTHCASVNFIHRYFGQAFQSRGQAIYISVAFGIGGAIGSYLAGSMWSQGTGAFQAFVFSASMAVISAVLLLFVAKNKMK